MRLRRRGRAERDHFVDIRDENRRDTHDTRPPRRRLRTVRPPRPAPAVVTRASDVPDFTPVSPRPESRGRERGRRGPEVSTRPPAERGAGRGGRGRGRGRPDGAARRRVTVGDSARAPDEDDFFSARSLRDLGVGEAMREALSAAGVTRASHVQAATWRALRLGAPHVLAADHAGSGKTLAYLVPVVEALKREEEERGGRATEPGRPRALVVLPTQELALQVAGVARGLTRSLPLRVATLTGGARLRDQRRMLREGIDVLLCTPGRAADLAAAGDLDLSAARFVVLDEADVLLGDVSQFRETVLPLRGACGEGTRFLFATATIPERCLEDLTADFPGLTPAVGRGLHRPAPGALVVVVDCSGGDEYTPQSGFARKAEALLEAVRQVPAARTLVFCNQIDSCRKVENLLKRQGGARVVAYHAAIREDVREENLEVFLQPPEGPGDRQILVCTDRASRGVDSRFVEHVVLFDFPRDPSEYIRRVGRTARGAGGKGLVTALVLGRQVPLAKEIVQRNGKGLPVHRIPDVEDFGAGATWVEVGPGGGDGALE